MDVDDKSGSMDSFQLLDVVVRLADGITHSKPLYGPVFVEVWIVMDNFIGIDANQRCP